VDRAGVKRSPLKRKPSTLKRTELARGDKPLRRTQLRAGRRKTRARIPFGVRCDVIVRTGGYCACGCRRLGTAPHHIFPHQRWPELVAEPDNLLWVADDCHMNHEAASKRFTRHVVWRAEHLAVTPAMSAYLDRTYGTLA
jgi:hypothetical protein